MEKVIEAAQKAQLHDFVMSLPEVSTPDAWLWDLDRLLSIHWREAHQNQLQLLK